MMIEEKQLIFDTHNIRISNRDSNSSYPVAIGINDFTGFIPEPDHGMDKSFRFDIFTKEEVQEIVNNLQTIINNL